MILTHFSSEVGVIEGLLTEITKSYSTVWASHLINCQIRGFIFEFYDTEIMNKLSESELGDDMLEELILYCFSRKIGVTNMNSLIFGFVILQSPMKLVVCSILNFLVYW